MKKTLIAVVLCLALALATSVLFVGCGDSEPVHKTCYDVDADGICDVCEKDIAGHCLPTKSETCYGINAWNKCTKLLGCFV